MKKTISVPIDEGKLSAIEMYLEQKNTTLTVELDRYIDQLYGKIVPQNVREYIEKLSAQQKRRERKTPDNSNKQEQ